MDLQSIVWPFEIWVQLSVWWVGGCEVSTLMFCTRLIDFLLAALFTDQIPDPDILCRSETGGFLSWPHFASRPSQV